MEREFSWLCGYEPERVFQGDEVRSNNLGLRLANYFHPQMWHVRCTRYLSPYETFCDNAKLAKAIRKALAIWPDRYGANASSLRRMLKSFSNTVGVSNFRPTVAMAIIDRYSPRGGRVLDFAAGYGGRLLGALVTGRSYHGIDAGVRQVEGLKAMAAACAPHSRVAIEHGAAEDALPGLRSGSFDLVFSSPPYHKREKYGTEPEQSFLRYPTIELWRSKFLRVVIEQSVRLLCRGGRLVLNASNGIDEMVREEARAGFRFEKQWRMRLAKLPYKRSERVEAYKWEPVLVFRKK